LADHRVGIEVVEDVSGDRASRVVRCLAGTVAVGDVFATLELPDGARGEVSLWVAGITRYGKAVEFVDPPHSAMLELSGDGVHLLAPGSVLAARHPVGT
jgi:hypothetical protein